MTVPYRTRLRPVAVPMRAVAHPVHVLTRLRGDREPPRPANRREADGAPAIGIEARKGRDPALPGLGAKHESPGPEGASPPEREPEETSRGHGPSCAGADA